MTVLLTLDHRIAGTVKFDKSVPVAKLATFIAELKARSPERWVDIHVRPAGDSGTHYIAVHYILADGRRKTEWKAIQSFLEYFCAQLGTRHKAGEKAEHPIANGMMSWSLATVSATV